MRRAYVLLEGPTDVAFLRRVLPDDALTDVELVNAGGYSGIPSLARSLLVRRHKPVAVVMDSDSLNPDVIDERRNSMEEVIRAADSITPVKVISIVPEIEAWFFASPEILERVVEQTVSADLLALGKRDPKGILQHLAEKNQKQWDTQKAINMLNSEDIQRIQAIPEVAELSTFLREVQKIDQAA